MEWKISSFILRQIIILFNASSILKCYVKQFYEEKGYYVFFIGC